MWAWQGLQHSLALLLIAVVRPQKWIVTFRESVVYLWPFRAGLSLGKYIFVGAHAGMDTLLHEWGHSRQSMMLGPLYLPVVGLPSLVMNVLTRMGLLRGGAAYYKRWPESWADRLGGVKRSMV